MLLSRVVSAANAGVGKMFHLSHYALPMFILLLWQYFVGEPPKTCNLHKSKLLQKVVIHSDK